MEASQPHEPGLRPVRLLEDTQQKFIRVHLHWGQASHAVFSEHAQSAHQASQDTGLGGEMCTPTQGLSLMSLEGRPHSTEGFTVCQAQLQAGELKDLPLWEGSQGSLVLECTRSPQR